MKGSVKWLGKAAFEARTESGHQILVDGPPAIGGENRGPRPMELMLLSVASCSAVDVVYILEKARQAVSGVEVDISGTRAETEPKVFTAIHLHFRIAGNGLAERQVARAVSLSAEKYCSASLMLGRGGVAVTHDHEIVAA